MWSDEIKAASGGKSLGNVRAMYDKIAGGKLPDIHFAALHWSIGHSFVPEGDGYVTRSKT